MTLPAQALILAAPEDILDAPDFYPLEDQEHALTELARVIAEKANAIQSDRRELGLAEARFEVIKRNVVEARRRAGRINCKLSDGSRIYDLEVVI